MEAVSLEVTLADDVQPRLIAHLEESLVRRVVGGADGVEVVLLHERNIEILVLQLLGAADERIRLVTVHAAEDDPLTVDAEDLPVHLDPAEADAQEMVSVSVRTVAS